MKKLEKELLIIYNKFKNKKYLETLLIIVMEQDISTNYDLEKKKKEKEKRIYHINNFDNCRYTCFRIYF